MKIDPRLILLLLIGFVDSACIAASPASADSHPNVLFLAIDDLNDWVGALGGHPQAKTPKLDRLISQSVFFRNAHCAAPVCSASRHALLSGLRPSTTGWYTNSSKSRESYEKTLGDTVPLPTHFKRNGYIPKDDAVPTSMKDGGTDSLGRKVQKFRSDGVPDWLGTEPVLPSKK